MAGTAAAAGSTSTTTEGNLGRTPGTDTATAAGRTEEGTSTAGTNPRGTAETIRGTGTAAAAVAAGRGTTRGTTPRAETEANKFAAISSEEAATGPGAASSTWAGAAGAATHPAREPRRRKGAARLRGERCI